MSKYRERLQKTMSFVLSHAQAKRVNAGRAGQMGDGGASYDELMVKLVRQVLNEEEPGCWTKEWCSVVKAEDADWAEYQRLKRKFNE